MVFEPRLPSISENFQHSLCRLTGNQLAVDLTNLYDMWEGTPLLLSQRNDEQLEAHFVYNQEYVGSSPISATQRLKENEKIKEKEYI